MWIEIVAVTVDTSSPLRRAPQGVRGLKLPSTMVCCPIYKKAVLFQSMWIEMAAGLRGGMLRKEARGLEFGVDKRSRKEG